MTKRYRLFGLTLESSFPFRFPLPSAEEPADLSFERDPQKLEKELGEKQEAVYESPFRDDAGRAVLRVLRRGDCDLLAFPGVAEFSVGQRRILYRPASPQRRELIEIRLLGTVLAYFLERSGLPALHASAVDVGGSAVAFLGGNRSGKSGLAASLMEAGHALLSDDVLPVEMAEGSPVARPAYPQMRAWPDLAAHLVGSFEGLPRVLPELDKRRIPVGEEGGFGSFCPESRPLTTVYLPERLPDGAAGEIRIEPLRPRDAVVELVRASFIARLVEALGWQARRLDFFARLVTAVPMRRLIYPSGFEHLPGVGAAILEDLTPDGRGSRG